MNTLAKRITKLEQHSDESAKGPTLITWASVNPASRRSVPAAAFVVGSGSDGFFRRQYSDDAEFWAAVDVEHQRVHGTPIHEGEQQ